MGQLRTRRHDPRHPHLKRQLPPHFQPHPGQRRHLQRLRRLERWLDRRLHRQHLRPHLALRLGPGFIGPSGSNDQQGPPWITPDQQALLFRKELIFVNGKALEQKLAKADLVPGSFYLDQAADKIYVRPAASYTLSAFNSALVEVGTRNGPLLEIRRKHNLILKDFVLQHAIGYPRDGGSFATSVTTGGWGHYDTRHLLAENILARWNGTQGLGFRANRYTTLRNCRAEYNGFGGFLLSGADVLIEDCTALGNNWKGTRAGFTGDILAGAKAAELTRATFERFTSSQNHCMGLWLDVGSRDITIRNSTLTYNDSTGLYFEIFQGPALVENTRIAHNGGSAIAANEARGLTLRNNTFFGNAAPTFSLGLGSGRSGNYTDPDSGRTFAWASIDPTDYVLTGNTITQLSPGDTFFSPQNGQAHWTDFISSLRTSGNTWLGGSPTPFLKADGTSGTFADWRAITGGDARPLDLASTHDRTSPLVSTSSTAGQAEVQLWPGLGGPYLESLTSDHAFQSNTPSQRYYTPILRLPPSAHQDLGARLRTRITAPFTGSYRFWISANRASELWLSTDSSPANRVLIASVPATATAAEQPRPGDWDRYPSQLSAPVTLTAGQTYYLEAFTSFINAGYIPPHTLTTSAYAPSFPGLASGIDIVGQVISNHLEVAWATPASDTSAGHARQLIPAANLSPDPTPSTLAPTATGSILREFFDDLSGPANGLAQLTAFSSYPNLPDARTYSTRLETPRDFHDTTGSRLRGTLIAPTTGTYRLWLSGEFRSRLIFNPNGSDPAGATTLLEPNHTDYRTWSTASDSRSVVLNLTAGTEYYIELQHIAQFSSGQASVGWSKPGDPTFDTAPSEVVPGSALRPLTLSLPAVSIVATTPIATAVPLTSGRFTLTRTGSTLASLTVSYSLSGTASEGTDYTALPGTATFAPGANTATIDVTPVPGAQAHVAKTIQLTLNSSPNITGAGANATVSLAPRTAASTLQFSASTYTAAENAGTATLTVTRTGTPTGPVSVAYSLTNGTAKSGIQFSPTNGTLSWAAGDTTPKSFTVPILTDGLFQSDLTATATLSTPAGDALLGALAAATLTLTNTDSAPSLSLSPTSPQWLTRSVGTTTFTVSLSRASGLPVSVNLTPSGTAFQNTSGDYTIATPTVYFSPGETSRVVTLQIAPVPPDAATNAADKSVFIDLTNLTNSTLLPGGTRYQATIANPAAATVTLTPLVTAASKEGPVNGRFRVTRTGDAAGGYSTAAALTVNLLISGTATTPADYVRDGFNNSFLNWVTIPAGQSSVDIDVLTRVNNTLHGGLTATFALAPSLAYRLGPAQTATITIADRPLGNALNASTVEGLRYEFFNNVTSGWPDYTGTWSSLPDFTALTPAGTVALIFTSTSPTFTTVQRGTPARNGFYGLRFTGYLAVPADGFYRFSVNSSNGSRLYLDDILIVDRNGLPGFDTPAGAPGTTSVPLGLKAGLHKISLIYFIIWGDSSDQLNVQWEGGGPTGTLLPRQTIPASALRQATALTNFRTTYALASDGSQDLLTPAADGVPNLLKYAFNMLGSGTGQAPTIATPNAATLAPSGSVGLPFASLGSGPAAGKLQLTFIRRKSSAYPYPGITYAVEFSNDLASWAPNPSATESPVSLDATFERVTVTDSAAVSARRFARVKVTAP